VEELGVVLVLEDVEELDVDLVDLDVGLGVGLDVVGVVGATACLNSFGDYEQFQTCLFR
jgi:hypothetical protein